MKLGAPAEKLVLGIPTYGRSFTLQDRTQHEPPMVATGGGQQGSITREGGYLGYQEICLNIKENGWEMVEDPQGPYAYKGNQWVGYDTITSVKVKADYILNKNLGGAMFWDVATDDFNVSFLLIERLLNKIYLTEPLWRWEISSDSRSQQYFEPLLKLFFLEINVSGLVHRTLRLKNLY